MRTAALGLRLHIRTATQFCTAGQQMCLLAQEPGTYYPHLPIRADCCSGTLQVEGAFIQGLGLFTSEEVITDEDTGRLITDGTWEYKIPAATCIPRQFNATFLKVSRIPAV